MMATKSGNQHEPLHKFYGENDCCLCKAEQTIATLRAENERLTAELDECHKHRSNYLSALELIASHVDRKDKTTVEELIAIAGNVMRFPSERVLDACRYWVDALKKTEAELTEARDIILRFLHDPGGCRFCDYGILRKPGVPGKDHDEDCLYVCVHAYLNKNISLDAKRDLSDAEIEEFGASEAESRVDE